MNKNRVQSRRKVVKELLEGYNMVDEGDRRGGEAGVSMFLSITSVHARGLEEHCEWSVEVMGAMGTGQELGLRKQKKF